MTVALTSIAERGDGDVCAGWGRRPLDDVHRDHHAVDRTHQRRTAESVLGGIDRVPGARHGGVVGGDRRRVGRRHLGRVVVHGARERELRRGELIGSRAARSGNAEFQRVDLLLCLVDGRLVCLDGRSGRPRRLVGRKLLLRRRQRRLRLGELELVLLVRHARLGVGRLDLQVERVELSLGLAHGRLVGVDRGLIGLDRGRVRRRKHRLIGGELRLVGRELLLRRSEGRLRLGELELVLLIRDARLSLRARHLQIERVDLLLGLRDGRLVGRDRARCGSGRLVGQELLLRGGKRRLRLGQPEVVLSRRLRPALPATASCCCAWRIESYSPRLAGPRSGRTCRRRAGPSRPPGLPGQVERGPRIGRVCLWARRRPLATLSPTEMLTPVTSQLPAVPPALDELALEPSSWCSWRGPDRTRRPL